MTALPRRAALTLPLGLLAAPRAARADWPDRPVRIVVAFPPGSSTDVLARALANAITPRLGQPVVVENRPGAGGNIATVALRRSAPDGATFLAHSVAFAVNPSLYRNAGYDALADLEPVALLASTPNIITANPDRLDVRTLPELIAAARTRPLDYGSSGTGTTTHLGMELLFRTLARVEVQHVPFGPAQAVTAVVGGQVPIGSTSLPPALAMVREGRLRGIAVEELGWQSIQFNVGNGDRQRRADPVTAPLDRVRAAGLIGACKRPPKARQEKRRLRSQSSCTRTTISACWRPGTRRPARSSPSPR